jgi:hypothetical protein
MLPVSSSDPATTTTTSPRVKTAPVISVWTAPDACRTAVPPFRRPQATLSRPPRGVLTPTTRASHWGLPDTSASLVSGGCGRVW